MISLTVFLLNLFNTFYQKVILFSCFVLLQNVSILVSYNTIYTENIIHRIKFAERLYKLKLYYYIQEGEIDVYSIKNIFLYNCFAGSGGGAYAGKNSSVLVSEDSRNNVCHLNISTVFNKNNEILVRGGPIVPGEYTFESDVLGDVSSISDNRYVSLSPNIKTRKNIKLLGRKGGFRIHCRGGHGSDGCIVPQKREDFWKILDYISKSDGGTLTVKKSRDGMEWSCGNPIIDNMD